jgi:hypothetical protein
VAETRPSLLDKTAYPECTVTAQFWGGVHFLKSRGKIKRCAFPGRDDRGGYPGGEPFLFILVPLESGIEMHKAKDTSEIRSGDEQKHYEEPRKHWEKMWKEVNER